MTSDRNSDVAAVWKNCSAPDLGILSGEDSMTLAQVEEAVRNGTIGDRVISIGQVLKDYPEIFVHGRATAFWKMEMRLLRDLSEESTKEGWVRMCDSRGVDSRGFTSGMR